MPTQTPKVLDMGKILERDILYRTIGDLKLVGRVYVPQGEGAAPFVIDAHGGAWGSGDRFNNQVIHQSFAHNGIGVFALEFRLSSQARFPKPVADVNYGVRWFKNHEKSTGARVGSSQGPGTPARPKELQQKSPRF